MGAMKRMYQAYDEESAERTWDAADAVEIQDGHVQCPHCNKNFEVQRTPRGRGAAYVKKWKTLKQLNRKILRMWIKHAPSESLTKNEIYRMCRFNGLQMSTGSCYARVSELLGCGAILTDGERRIAPDETTTAPKYTLSGNAAYYESGGELWK